MNKYDKLRMIDVSNSNNKIFSLDGILFLTGSENLITANKEFYINFINGDKRLQKYHRHLCDNMSKTISNYVKSDTQNGGSLALSLTYMGIGLSGVIAYFIYKWVTWETCEKIYPISKEGEVITPTELLLKIIPSSWTRGLSPDNIVDSIRNKAKNLANIFSPLDTNSSTTKRVFVDILRVTASVGLDVITFGAGGDVIISLLFTFKTVLDLLSTLIEGFVELLDDSNAIRFLKDLTNINFKKGPFGVKCWVDYILREYGNQTIVYSVICKFFSMIFNKVVAFVSNAVGAMIPNSAGLPAILIPILINYFRDRAMDIIEDKINSYYEEISHDWKTFIKNPKLMKEYLDSNIQLIENVPNFLTNKKIRDYILGLKQNTGAFAYLIHKFFAITYVTLYVLKSCFEKEKEQGNIESVTMPSKTTPSKRKSKKVKKNKVQKIKFKK